MCAVGFAAHIAHSTQIIEYKKIIKKNNACRGYLTVSSRLGREEQA